MLLLPPLGTRFLAEYAVRCPIVWVIPVTVRFHLLSLWNFELTSWLPLNWSDSLVTLRLCESC